MLNQVYERALLKKGGMKSIVQLSKGTRMQVVCAVWRPHHRASRMIVAVVSCMAQCTSGFGAQSSPLNFSQKQAQYFMLAPSLLWSGRLHALVGPQLMGLRVKRVLHSLPGQKVSIPRGPGRGRCFGQLNMLTTDFKKAVSPQMSGQKFESRLHGIEEGARIGERRTSMR
jgi:hypothetical protein